MRYTILISIILLAILTGCNKEKFGTTPTLDFVSVSTTELRPGEIIQFKLGFTDKEGDISDSIYVEKVIVNCSADNADQKYKIPEIPTTINLKGDILVTFGYNAEINYPPVGTSRCPGNDSVYYRFVLTDQAKHVSDTVTSPTIIIYK